MSCRSASKRKAPASATGSGPVKRSPSEVHEELTDVGAKRRPWTSSEDEQLKRLVAAHGVKNWAQIATELHMRNGKQCRERWRNHLRPELNKGDWTQDEDVTIWNRVQQLGTKWAQISELYMPLRTDNDIKNRWNSIIRKSSHPSGRAWKPNEITLREEVLSSARVTQQRRLEPPQQRRKRQRTWRVEGKGAGSPDEFEGEDSGAEEDFGGDFDVGDGLFPLDILEQESPMPLRKLFGSPGTPPAPPSRHSPDTELPREEPSASEPPPPDLPAGGAAPSHRSGGAPDSSGSDASLASPAAPLGRQTEAAAPSARGGASLESSPLPPAALRSPPPAGACSPSQHPRINSSRVSSAIANWFETELDVSLSPLLTPSLRRRPASRLSPASAGRLSLSGASAGFGTAGAARSPLGVSSPLAAGRRSTASPRASPRVAALSQVRLTMAR